MRWPPRNRKEALRALQDLNRTMHEFEGRRPTELAIADLITALDVILVALSPPRRRRVPVRPRRR
jgi:hypothetical protein